MIMVINAIMTVISAMGMINTMRISSDDHRRRLRRTQGGA